MILCSNHAVLLDVSHQSPLARINTTGQQCCALRCTPRLKPSHLDTFPVIVSPVGGTSFQSIAVNHERELPCICNSITCGRYKHLVGTPSARRRELPLWGCEWDHECTWVRSGPVGLDTVEPPHIWMGSSLRGLGLPRHAVLALKVLKAVLLTQRSWVARCRSVCFDWRKA